MRRAFRPWLAGLLLVCCRPLAAQDAPAADPLLLAIPGQAGAAILLDLRPGTETAKTWARVQTPEQSAVVRAIMRLALQQTLQGVAPDLDLDADVLPWLTGRATLVFMANDDPLLLVETTGGTAAAAGFERVVQAGVRAGRLSAVPAVAGVPAWEAGGRPARFCMARFGPVVAFGETADALSTAPRQALAPAAAPSAVAHDLAATPPGLLRVAIRYPTTLPQAGRPPEPLPVSGLSASLGLAGDAVAGQAVLALTPTARAALAGLKPTFGESVAGIPDSAAAVLVAGRPGPTFAALGMPTPDRIGAEAFPSPPLREACQALLAELFQQEVGVALVPTAAGSAWLAVLTTARPDDLMQRVFQVMQAGRGVTEVAWNQAPIGEVPAWSVELPLHPERRTRVHFAVLEARLLLAGDRAALEAGVATLRGTARPVTTAGWYRQASGSLDPESTWKLLADLPALGRALSSTVIGRVIGPGRPAQVSPRHAADLAQALLAGFGRGAVGARLHEDGLRLRLRADLDPEKLASLGVSVPLAVAMAAAAPGLTRSRQRARVSACQSNLKQLALAALMYAQDHNEQLPPAENWIEALMPYLKNRQVLRCPADHDAHPCSYALNRAVSQLPLAQVGHPAETILFYETTSAQACPAGTGEEMPDPPRHGGAANLAFVDGHVKAHWGPFPKEWWDPNAPAPK